MNLKQTKTCRDEAIHKNLTPCSLISLLGKEVPVAKRNGCEAVSPYRCIPPIPRSNMLFTKQAEQRLVAHPKEMQAVVSHRKLIASIAMNPAADETWVYNVRLLQCILQCLYLHMCTSRWSCLGLCNKIILQIRTPIGQTTSRSQPRSKKYRNASRRRSITWVPPWRVPEVAPGQRPKPSTIISRMKTDGLTERKVSLTNLNCGKAGSDAATRPYKSAISQP